MTVTRNRDRDRVFRNPPRNGIRSVIRRILAALALLLASPARALDLADPAPPLGATAWVQGGPVDLAARRGNGPTVVAFWATWCAPSVRAIETLASVEKAFSGRGVVVVGMSVADPNNDLERVRRFVEERKGAMPYAVAFDEGETTWTAWMTASGRKSVSTAFVVDRDGRIAWIGDPRRGLEKVLEDLLAGRWTAEGARRLADLERRFEGHARAEEWTAALASAEELAGLLPHRGHALRYHALLRLARGADALSAARASIDAGGDDPATLLSLGRSLASQRAEGRAFEDLALAALDRAIALEPESIEVPTTKFDYLLAWGRAGEAQDAGALIVQRLHDAADELNNFAWGLLTEDSKKGKFNPLAVLAASRASELTGEASWYILDTLALARFEMGEGTEAVRLEERALEIARREGVPEGQRQTLEDALARFRKGK